MIITGTDTDIGKTIVSAMLTLALGRRYFKPIQCGTDPETDEKTVKRLTGLGADRVLPTAVTLAQPRSPHFAAELDHVEINLDQLKPPAGGVIVEGAGGLLVPVNRETLFIDLFAAWKMPVVLVARTGLGTLNHTLLSLESLRTRNIDVVGVVFVGDDNPDNIKTISEMGKVKVLGRVPMLDEINAKTLQATFDQNFKAADFGESL